MSKETRQACDEKKKAKAEAEGEPWKPMKSSGASTTDPDTWSSYDVALRAHQAGRYDGIGIMLDGKVDENGLVLAAIDLDKVDGDTKREARAAEIIEAIDSYTERSPSGTGYRIFLWANIVLPKGGLIHDGVEFYSNIGRFLTVTGHVEGGQHEIKAASDAFTKMIAKHIPSDVFEKAMGAEARRTAPGSDGADWGLGPVPDHLREFVSSSDADLRTRPNIKTLRDLGPALAPFYGERSRWLELVESIAGTIAQWPDMEAELVSLFHELSALAPGWGGEDYPRERNEAKLQEFIGKARARYTSGGSIRTISSLIFEAREALKAAGGPVEGAQGSTAEQSVFSGDEARDACDEALKLMLIDGLDEPAAEARIKQKWPQLIGMTTAIVARAQCEADRWKPGTIRTISGLQKRVTSIGQLNERFVLLMLAGQPSAVAQIKDALFLTMADFAARLGDSVIVTGVGKDMVVKTTEASKVWIADHRRRIAEKIVFTSRKVGPECLNLWTGFGVTPTPGNCPLIYQHIHEVICAGHDRENKAFLDLTAWQAQNIGRASRIIVALYSEEQQVGKGVLLSAP